MFCLNVFGTPEPLSMYVARPSGEILGCIDDIIEESSASLTISLNSQYTLEFSVRHVIGSKDWFEYIHEGMYILVEKVGWFKLHQPVLSIDGVTETKSVTAMSIDCELEDRTCGMSINIGLKTSMEYLVTYDTGETEALENPYTGIPYDWIVLYNMFPEQLTAVKEKLNNDYYGMPNSHGDIVVTDSTLMDELTKLFNTIPRLKSKVIYSGNIYGSTDSTLVEYVITGRNSSNLDIITSYTLTPLFTTRVDNLITFYSKYRKQLSLLDLVLGDTHNGWAVGDIWGVAGGDYTLANVKCQFEIDETAYSFLTQTLAKAINCVVNFDIYNRKVNITPVEEIGDDTGIVMAYDNLVNTLNIETDEESLATRLYVTGADDLTIERVNFGSNYVDDITYKLNVRDSNGNRVYVSDALAQKYTEYIAYREQQRLLYINLSKQYEEYAKQISEIENRLPNDDLKTDWGTFSLEELMGSLTVYKNLLVTLKSLYKSEFGDAGLNADGSINDAYIKNTAYWWDYTAYNSIIKEIQCAIATYPNYNDQSQWTAAQISEYADEIKWWETEWSLYGTVELQAKIATYKQNMDILAQESVIRVSEGSYVIKTWSALTDDEKAEYGNSQELYKYDTYMEYYSNMLSAQRYLNRLLSQIETLKSNQSTALASRSTIVQNVALENYFTQDECEIIGRLYKDADYSNENILVTSIDSSSEKIDRMNELLEDGKEQASISSRPQLMFSVEANNLLAITDFEAFWKSFSVGNYVLVQYKDDTYVKLRMIEYTFNPCLPSSEVLDIVFSNYVRSKSYYRDWGSLIGDGGSSGVSSRSSGSGGGSDGEFGDSDDIDITISNTMLAKLLNTELFGTRVTDVILDTLDANLLTARRATFGGLASGTTDIDGKCIKTGYIIDALYNGTEGNINNTAGSIINLETGLFSLGGGTIKYDGSALAVNGAIVARTLTAGDKTSASATESGLFIDSDGNLYSGADNETIIYADGTFSFGDGKLVYDGSNLTVHGAVIATSLSAGGKTSASHNHDGIYIASTGNLIAGANSTTIIYANGTFNFGNGKLLYNGTNLTVNGAIIADSLSAGGKTSASHAHTGLYIGSTGNLVAGANSETIIYADGRLNLGNGKLTYNGTDLKVNNVIAKSFKALGTDESISCTLGDELKFINDSSGTDPRLARFSDLYGTVSGTKIYDSFEIYGNQIGFTKTNNGSWYLLYSGQNAAQMTGHLTIDKTLTVDGHTYLGGNVAIGMQNNGEGYLTGGVNNTAFAGVHTSSSDAFNNKVLAIFGGSAKETSGIDITVLRGDTVRIFASTDGAVYLGATGSTAITSDETLKDLSEIDSRYVDFFDQLNPVAYKYKVGHRTHLGFGAQSVEKAIYDAGLTTEEFAGILIDKDVVLGDGEVISPDGATYFEKLYSIRYEEFIALNTMMIKKLQTEIKELKEQLGK